TMMRERSRIAREIHDSLIYTLTNLLALLNAYREKLNAVNKIIPDELNQARELVLSGLNDVRHFLSTIRPKDYDDDIGLGKTKRLATVFNQSTGVEVELNFGDVPQFIDKELEQVIYRIVQEGLTNSFRHGKATQIFINFNLFKNGISLSIKDNGCGVDLIKFGYGLTGIQERVEELGGKIKIISRVGDGFTLQAWFPLKGGVADD
ncbi:MAG: sensor histidine kinase, partial [Bacteroidota bacterium]